MKRKRPETTIYLGDEVLKNLQEYRNRFPYPPSLSSIVREAVESYITEKLEGDSAMTPASWVDLTDAHFMRLRAKGFKVSTDSILKSLNDSEDERIGDMIGSED